MEEKSEVCQSRKKKTNDFIYVVKFEKKVFFQLIFFPLVISIFCGICCSKKVSCYLKKKNTESGKKYISIDNIENIERLYETPGMSHQIIGHFIGVKKAFLLSEEEVIDVIKNVANKAQTSSHLVQCTDRNSTGLTCDSVMADRSHLIIHTFASDGFSGHLEFNLLLSGERQMIIENTVFPELEKSVSKHYTDEVYEVNGQFYMHKNPTVNWIIKVRQGNNEKMNIRNPYLGGDLACPARFLGNYHTSSKHIDTIETSFQRIDVYDFMDLTKTSSMNYYEKIIEDDSYKSRNRELFQPNRVIFLDGVMQSTSKGNEAYHEALVQPAMFAHKNPRNVAIVGGGEGATLREALKHKSVEKVIMIDIDEEMCKESAKILYPAWNSCNDYFNSTNSCFDDPRADVRYEDALSWFIDRYLKEDPRETKFDIIIMDALDPQDTIEFAVVLYQNADFWKSLYNSLTDDGILVVQLGKAPELKDPGQANDKLQQNRHIVLQILQSIGFLSFHSYEEAHCGFGDPWTFLVACKSTVCRSNWHRTPAEVDLDIYYRIHRTISKQTPLQYFDGATMASYHVPHKSTEAVYCRDLPIPQECIFQQKFYNYHNSEYGITINLHGAGKTVPTSSNAIYTLYQAHSTSTFEPVDEFLRLLTHTPEKQHFDLDTFQYENISRLDTVNNDTITHYSKYDLTSDDPVSSYLYSPVIQRHLPRYTNLIISQGAFSITRS